MRLHIVRLLLMTLIVLPAVTSCYNYDQEESVVYSDPAANYINVTISVSASDNAFTRAIPNGGEYGDGTEDANDRENEVKNITLIFYQDAAGINTTNENAEVVSVLRYAVRPMTDNDKPTIHNHKANEPSGYDGKEVLYTTGNQKLEGTLLEKNKTYKMLVVANTFVNVNIGDKIKNVRDKLASDVFNGSGIGINATDFVMASETEAEVTMNDPDDVEITSNETSMIYYFPCIHIERLAARIDYCTKGAVYDSNYNGYKYNLGLTDNDGFCVITKVIPFNIYNGQEYLFKRVRNNWTDETPAITYLGDESTTNYVVDPKTANKDNSNTEQPVYLNPIAEMSSIYTQTMSSLSDGQTFIDDNGYNNVIIAYPKENTLMPSSYLKKYATGIAFEAKYYASASATPVTRFYYHYLRHQGELSTGDYQAHQWDDLSDTEYCSLPMNYGVVRNNIYRISVKVNQQGLQFFIKVKKWDEFMHDIIYM